MYSLMAFLCGLIFGLGLTVSNMINPNKVLNFLDVFGNWDPTLLVVMAAALLITVPGYQFILKLNKPMFDKQFYMPKKINIEKHLIIGSMIFGIGWGLSGYCPGPGIAALSTWAVDPLYFVIGLLIGSLTFFGFFKQ
ncbi:DUF6691 family protein [Legionella oakridgensis]|uniref:Transporter protein n=2 Tax=Legionella oakridgensis TaxID=29423 RepID=A0A0W0WXX1_9GAMM|nr:DUF6691 family protein [Legionella oakridgensis]AHE67012.1 putative transporter component [Legionella oakridgensis ATCC 33761 = DSM 21215]ETO93301.1 putative transporter component [Legionella oakridgensis RV-2-2007]KTD37166.1 transporter protein [Legionella oakridgensis]STY20111.1 transporter protein [Legionella longbeachae]